MAEGLCKRDCGAELVKLDHVRALRNEALFGTFSSGSKKTCRRDYARGHTDGRPWFGGCHGMLLRPNICGPICSKDQAA